MQVYVDNIIFEVEELDEPIEVVEPEELKALNKKNGGQNKKTESKRGFLSKVVDGVRFEVHEFHISLKLSKTLPSSFLDFDNPFNVLRIELHRIKVYTTDFRWKVQDLQESRRVNKGKPHVLLFKQADCGGVSVYTCNESFPLRQTFSPYFRRFRDLQKLSRAEKIALQNESKEEKKKQKEERKARDKARALANKEREKAEKQAVKERKEQAKRLQREAKEAKKHRKESQKSVHAASETNTTATATTTAIIATTETQMAEEDRIARLVEELDGDEAVPPLDDVAETLVEQSEHDPATFNQQPQAGESNAKPFSYAPNRTKPSSPAAPAFGEVLQEFHFDFPGSIPPPRDLVGREISLEDLTASVSLRELSDVGMTLCDRLPMGIRVAIRKNARTNQQIALKIDCLLGNLRVELTENEWQRLLDIVRCVQTALSYRSDVEEPKSEVMDDQESFVGPESSDDEDEEEEEEDVEEEDVDPFSQDDEMESLWGELEGDNDSVASSVESLYSTAEYAEAERKVFDVASGGTANSLSVAMSEFEVVLLEENVGKQPEKEKDAEEEEDYDDDDEADKEKEKEKVEDRVLTRIQASSLVLVAMRQANKDGRSNQVVNIYMGDCCGEEIDYVDSKHPSFVTFLKSSLSSRMPLVPTRSASQPQRETPALALNLAEPMLHIHYLSRWNKEGVMESLDLLLEFAMIRVVYDRELLYRLKDFLSPRLPMQNEMLRKQVADRASRQWKVKILVKDLAFVLPPFGPSHPGPVTLASQVLTLHVERFFCHAKSHGRRKGTFQHGLFAHGEFPNLPSDLDQSKWWNEDETVRIFKIEMERASLEIASEPEAAAMQVFPPTSLVVDGVVYPFNRLEKRGKPNPKVQEERPLPLFEALVTLDVVDVILCKSQYEYFLRVLEDRLMWQSTTMAKPLDIPFILHFAGSRGNLRLVGPSNVEETPDRERENPSSSSSSSFDPSQFMSAEVFKDFFRENAASSHTYASSDSIAHIIMQLHYESFHFTLESLDRNERVLKVSILSFDISCPGKATHNRLLVSSLGSNPEMFQNVELDHLSRLLVDVGSVEVDDSEFVHEEDLEEGWETSSESNSSLKSSVSMIWNTGQRSSIRVRMVLGEEFATITKFKMSPRKSQSMESVDLAQNASSDSIDDIVLESFSSRTKVSVQACNLQVFPVLRSAASIAQFFKPTIAREAVRQHSELEMLEISPLAESDTFDWDVVVKDSSFVVLEEGETQRSDWIPVSIGCLSMQHNRESSSRDVILCDVQDLEISKIKPGTLGQESGESDVKLCQGFGFVTSLVRNLDNGENPARWLTNVSYRARALDLAIEDTDLQMLQRIVASQLSFLKRFVADWEGDKSTLQVLQNYNHQAKLVELQHLEQELRFERAAIHSFDRQRKIDYEALLETNIELQEQLAAMELEFLQSHRFASSTQSSSSITVYDQSGHAHPESSSRIHQSEQIETDCPIAFSNAVYLDETLQIFHGRLAATLERGELLIFPAHYDVMAAIQSHPAISLPLAPYLWQLVDPQDCGAAYPHKQHPKTLKVLQLQLLDGAKINVGIVEEGQLRKWVGEMDQQNSLCAFLPRVSINHFRFSSQVNEGE